MSKTTRNVGFREGGQAVERKLPEVGSRWRLERAERLIRRDRDNKKIERAEARAARADENDMPLGSTVRVRA